MSSTLNNPASRLLYIIEEARQIDRNTPARKAWAALTQKEINDQAGIFLGIAQLIQLAADTKTQLRELSQSEGYSFDLYAAPIDFLINLISHTNIDGGWAETIEKLDPANYNGLKFCADLLSSNTSEQEIPNQKLQDIINQTDALEAQISESDLPQDLKSFLILQLERLRNAVLRYRIFGTEELKAALERIAGSHFFAPHIIGPCYDHPLVQKVWQFLDATETLIQLSQGYPMLIAAIPTLLGPGRS